MKKLLVVLMVVLLCLPPCGVAEGALPTVSFDVSTQTQNGGVPFFLTVKLSAPASNELFGFRRNADVCGARGPDSGAV